MSPDEIARSYDELADHWNSDAFSRNNGIEQHKRALTFLANKRLALDVGCGSSGRFIDLLINHGFDVDWISKIRSKQVNACSC